MITVFGESNVGKSSFLRKLGAQELEEDLWSLDFEGKTYCIVERREGPISGPCILMYDGASRRSFENAMTAIKDISCQLVLVANKSEIRTYQHTPDGPLKFPFYEVSAKRNINIQEPLLHLIA